jgi:hypothetical protein
MSKSYLDKLKNRNIQIEPLAPYISSRVKIPHKCTKGHIWLAEPKRIIEGRGCPICSGRIKKTTQEYESELITKNIPYIVEEEYEGTHIPILHKCGKGHSWKARPSQILSGRGCPSCATFRVDPNSPAALYYIRIDTDITSYYKIGITTRTIKERFRDESHLKITELYYNLFPTAQEALELENNILCEFSQYRNSSVNILKSGGNTELFNKDVLGFDT